ncbi:MAG: hypothetical protein WCA22_02615 [Candidatus Binatus sp.]
MERNHIEEAIALLRQAVQLDAESFHSQLALGIALTKGLEIPAAEAALEAAISLEPRSFWAHFRMGELFQRVGVPGKAKEEFQTALDLAQTSEEKKIARDRLESEQKRDPVRAWRPDFAGLLRRKKRK